MCKSARCALTRKFNEQQPLVTVLSQPHSLVHVRGTERTYTPVLCQDEKCLGQEKGVHMYCPLCSVAEAYQEPVFLRIKHVDKGIHFAGLKVLCCCIHCEIVSTIKGEKRFKSAHWHFYRCRNGFNRRDGAIKHYKTSEIPTPHSRSKSHRI